MTTETKNGRFKSIIGWILSAAVGAGVWYWAASGNHDPPDIQRAKGVLEETLDAPSTAKYLSAEVVATEKTYRMVHVVLDAQNAYGAMLRKSLCVTYHFNDDHYYWNKDYAVQTCDKPPTEDEIKLLKIMNHWGEQ